MLSTVDVDVAIRGGRTMRTAVVLPEGDPPSAGWPGVIVVHEAFGLNDDIRSIAVRLADHGYAAVAPDLLSAGNRLRCLVRLLGQVVAFDTDGVAMSHLYAAREELARRRGVDTTRTAVIGFCMGGGFALMYAARGDLRAASVNYGQVPSDASALRTSCPVVASFGAEDAPPMRAMPGRLEDALTSYDIAHDIETYPGAGHSFMNRDGGPAWFQRIVLPTVGRSSHPGYRPEQAEAAWDRIFAFFDQHVRR